MTFYPDVCCCSNLNDVLWLAWMCNESTWHHKTFLAQLYWHLAMKLQSIVLTLSNEAPVYFIDTWQWSCNVLYWHLAMKLQCIVLTLGNEAPMYCIDIWQWSCCNVLYWHLAMKLQCICNRVHCVCPEPWPFNFFFSVVLSLFWLSGSFMALIIWSVKTCALTVTCCSPFVHALSNEAGAGQFMTGCLPLTTWSQVPPVSLSVSLCA